MRDHNDRAINLVNGELCARVRVRVKVRVINGQYHDLGGLLETQMRDHNDRAQKFGKW